MPKPLGQTDGLMRCVICRAMALRDMAVTKAAPGSSRRKDGAYGVMDVIQCESRVSSSDMSAVSRKRSSRFINLKPRNTTATTERNNSRFFIPGHLLRLRTGGIAEHPFHFQAV